MIEGQMIFIKSTLEPRRLTALYSNVVILFRKQLWASGYCNGFEHHRPRVQYPFGTELSNEIPTDYHHISIMKLSVRWCVWKVGEEFPGWVLPRILKWVVVYSSVTFQSKLIPSLIIVIAVTFDLIYKYDTPQSKQKWQFPINKGEALYARRYTIDIM